MTTPGPSADRGGADWPCAAYGVEGLAHGARCFLADTGERVCASRAECNKAMTSERQRVFRLISAGAAAGDPGFTYLDKEFATPGDLLNADDDEDRQL